MNEAVREVSVELNCSLYDLDKDAWSIAGLQHGSQSALERLFRDRTAPEPVPVPKIAVAAAEKMLGRQYSGYLQTRGGPQVDLTGTDVFGRMIVRIIRIANKNEKGKDSPKEAAADSNTRTASSAFLQAAMVTDDLPAGQVSGGKSPSKAETPNKYLSSEEIKLDADYDAKLSAARAQKSGVRQPNLNRIVWKSTLF